MKNSDFHKFNQFVARFLAQLEYAQDLGEESLLFPHHIHIEPTNTCNLRCIHCIQERMTRKRGLMRWEIYTRIINEIAPLGCSVTLDVQGEPLLHPQITEMVDYAKEKGCHVSLLTNATRLSVEVSSRLIHNKLDRIVFSFDAIEKDLYEKIRKRADFQVTLYNILKFIELNCQMGQPTFVCMSIIRQEATRGHIDTYKEYFNALPIHTLFVSDLLNMSGASKTAEEINLGEKKLIPRSDWPVCRVPWENITINWDGTICPCPLDYDIIWPAGNVGDMRLQDIWNSKAFRTFRRAHLDHDYSDIEQWGVLCSECNCLWDPEYDMRRYKDFAKSAIVRQAQQYSKSLLHDHKGTSKNWDERCANLKRLLSQFQIS